VTVDARVDYDNGRVVQWNDISHSENHLKQNHADKSPQFEMSDTEGETIVFGKNNAYVSSQPVQLFEKADSGLTAFITFKHFKSEKPTSGVLLNYGAGGLKLQNHNLEVGMKMKGDACMFFVHRGSGRMTMSGKVTLKPDDKYHVLTVKIFGGPPEEGALSLAFALDGKELKASEKNKVRPRDTGFAVQAAGLAGISFSPAPPVLVTKLRCSGLVQGWLKRGKYPTLKAPIEVGARVDGNKVEGTIGAHMSATADSGFNGIISEVVIYGKEMTAKKQAEMEQTLIAAQAERTSPACLAGSAADDDEASKPDDMPAEEALDESRWDYVTCKSAIKLRHRVLNVRLHSSEIGYGSGSQQQAVTGNPDSGNSGSYWQVVPSADAETPCMQGELMKHGDKLRLLHLGTKKNLHSHQYQSPLSNKQEVSAFGDDGVGDPGDEWILQVREKGDAYSAGWGGPWLRDSIVRFKHVVTGQYLFSHRKQFNNGPVQGHNEITCSPRADDRTQWVVEEGIFHPIEKS
jgi:hypothetical protein